MEKCILVRQNDPSKPSLKNTNSIHKEIKQKNQTLLNTLGINNTKSIANRPPVFIKSNTGIYRN